MTQIFWYIFIFWSFFFFFFKRTPRLKVERIITIKPYETHTEETKLNASDLKRKKKSEQKIRSAFIFEGTPPLKSNVVHSNGKDLIFENRAPCSLSTFLASVHVILHSAINTKLMFCSAAVSDTCSLWESCEKLLASSEGSGDSPGIWFLVTVVEGLQPLLFLLLAEACGIRHFEESWSELYKPPRVNGGYLPHVLLSGQHKLMVHHPEEKKRVKPALAQATLRFVWWLIQ